MKAIQFYLFVNDSILTWHSNDVLFSVFAEVNRRTLTDNGVTEAAVSLLKHPNEDVQTFAVRTLANICFDSGASSAGTSSSLTSMRCNETAL